MARDGTPSGGRKKGSLNKRTQETRDRIAKVLALIESQYLDEDIKKLTATQRLSFYSDLIEYAVPKLARVEHEGGTNDELTIRIVRGNNKT